MAMNNNHIERSIRPDIQTPNMIGIKDIKVALDGVLMKPSVIDSVYYPNDRTFEIDLRFSMDEFIRKKKTNELHNMIYNKTHESSDRMTIRKVIFNDPATIVFWEDGTKTVVKCTNEDYDPEKGLAMAIAKKVFNNKGNYYNVFKRWLPAKTEEIEPEPAREADPYEKAVENLMRSILGFAFGGAGK